MPSAWRVVADDYSSPYIGRVRMPRFEATVPPIVTPPGTVIEYDASAPALHGPGKRGIWAWRTLEPAIEMQDEIPGSRLLELDYADADVVSLWTERQGPALVVRRCRVVRELDELDRLVEVARVHATRPDSSIHGVDHWERVGRNGEQLAAETAGADIEVVRVFAAFHDSQRLNDGRDPEHGARAAEKVRQLELGLSRAQLDTLCAALADHDRGNVSDDPTVGSCWDADRLDLVRLGIRPRPALMSTAAGKELAETG